MLIDFAAFTIPLAIVAQLTMPPKTFTRIALTCAQTNTLSRVQTCPKVLLEEKLGSWSQENLVADSRGGAVGSHSL